jgi:hypothetical protein
MLARDEMLAALRTALEPRSEVLEAYLFGSFARGEDGRALSRYCHYVPQLARIRTAREARRARGEFGR